MVLGTRSAASRSRVAFSVRPSASRMSATSPQKHAFFPISQLSEAFRRTGCAPRGDPPAHHKRTLFFRLRSSVKLFVEEKAREEAFRRPWQKAGVSEPQGHLSLGEVDDDIRAPGPQRRGGRELPEQQRSEASRQLNSRRSCFSRTDPKKRNIGIEGSGAGTLRGRIAN